jgi:hypothetical protein
MKQRLWRWRSNPMRRREDVLEAWVVLVMWLVVLLGGVLVGVFTAHAAGAGLDAQRETRHPVQAVLTEDAPRTPVATSTGDDMVRASVRWTGPDGATHIGETQVKAGDKAGQQVRVWTDGNDRLTSRPAQPTEAALQSALVGTVSAVVFSGLVYGAGRGVCWRLDVHRDARWEKEWKDIGPAWDHRAR